jgi:putative transposase
VIKSRRSALRTGYCTAIADYVVWTIDFQSDSTIDGKDIKVRLDDRRTARCPSSLSCFATTGGPPQVLRLDSGPEMVFQALQQFCDGKVGMTYIPPGCPWDNGCIESFNNRPRKGGPPESACLKKFVAQVQRWCSRT